MTRDLQKRFEGSWPEISTRLRYLLARYRVPAGKREDVIQETATRLVSIWSQVDPARPVWPLAKTIALNLLRDEARRVFEEIPTDNIDRDDPDMDPVLMARLEWNRVLTAMGSLTPSQREVLLREIGEGDRTGSAAEKMMRMRARKSLRDAMERLPAILVTRLRSLEWGALFGPIGQTAVPGLACLACLSLLPPPVATDVPSGPIDGGVVVVAEQQASFGSGGTAFSLSEELRASRERVEPTVRKGEAGSQDPPSGSPSGSSGSSGPALPGPKLPTTPGLPGKAPVDDDVAVQAAPSPK
ncbi:MAG: sigma-70 family RNA polymerase sigma factor, partial [Actinomycetota bacterium]